MMQSTMLDLVVGLAATGLNHSILRVLLVRFLEIAKHLDSSKVGCQIITEFLITSTVQHSALNLELC